LQKIEDERAVCGGAPSLGKGIDIRVSKVGTMQKPSVRGIREEPVRERKNAGGEGDEGGGVFLGVEKKAVKTILSPKGSKGGSIGTTKGGVRGRNKRTWRFFFGVRPAG